MKSILTTIIGLLIFITSHPQPAHINDLRRMIDFKTQSSSNVLKHGFIKDLHRSNDSVQWFVRNKNSEEISIWYDEQYKREGGYKAMLTFKTTNTINYNKIVQSLAKSGFTYRNKTNNFVWHDGTYMYDIVSKGKGNSLTLIKVYGKEVQPIPAHEDSSPPKAAVPNKEKVVVAAKFPGGTDSLMKFIRGNLVYPPDALDAETQGRVKARFVVDTDGSIGEIKIVDGVPNGCNEEVIRVIRKMPRWQPAIKDGVPVRSFYTLPVTFKLAN